MGLLIMCLCISCTANGATEGFAESPSPTETVPVTEEPSAVPSPSETVLPTEEPNTEEPDTEGPVISGVQPLTTTAGGTLSYRDGVTAVDDRDGTVPFQVDSSQVDLNVPGEYEVIYSAEDSSGNRTEVTTTVTVTEPEPEPTPSGGGQTGSQPKAVTLDDVNALADKVLAKIISDGMTQAQKAKAIYDYVRTHIVYVGYSDKSSWIIGAYNGFKTGRGDCFNYYACSKALLTRAGIPNVDIKRVGGITRHYWNLVDVGTGYYHFDACPHDNSYYIDSFMLTDAETEEYTAWRGGGKNYYGYDHSAISVTVATTPYRGTAWHAPGWTPPAEPEPEDPTVPEPEDPTVPEPEDPTEPEPEDPTVPDPEDPAEPEPEDPTEPEPEDPAEPEPENPAEPELEDPAQSESNPEEAPETEGQED